MRQIRTPSVSDRLDAVRRISTPSVSDGPILLTHVKPARQNEILSAIKDYNDFYVGVP